MPIDVLIIGAGLSGLTAAQRLIEHGVNCQVIEAAERPGGRILSSNHVQATGFFANSYTTVDEGSTADSCGVDMGPAWFWPDQTGIRSLIDQLGMTSMVFEQQSEGLSVLEYGDGSVQRVQGGASMAGSYRMRGGMMSLINALILTAGPVRFNCRATRISLADQNEVCVAIDNEAGELETVSAPRVIIAMPPRVVARTITFEPTCTDAEHAAMTRIPTWMAGQAKVAVICASPFWRQAGLSGDAMSQRGPVVEWHDASPPHGEPFALSGFIGLPVATRLKLWPTITTLITEQVVRLFHTSADQILDVSVYDWSQSPLITSPEDWGQRALPVSSPPMFAADVHQRLLWAGSESACSREHSCGYMEGAVEAGWAAADQVIGDLT